MTTSYNAANQLTQWGASTLSYDANGNLTDDGVNAYSWNARNQLMAISGGATAVFAYDAFGRRTHRTVGLAAADFLYDGANPVQEQLGGGQVANLLTGLGVDEYFVRTDPVWSQHFLTDGLGSTVALTDSAGTVATEYTYEPFGATSVSGAATSNSFQYTGRENDGTGLYFYRARYYNPTWQRFTSEDPVGFAAGDTNLYAYVFDSPTNFRDPSGLRWDFWNNPFMDFLGEYADYLPGICSGGAFLWYGGGPQAGPFSAGAYGLREVTVDFKDLFHPKFHREPLAALLEVGADGGRAGVGYGVVAGRKGVQEQLLFFGREISDNAAAGLLVGSSTEHGWNPLYNERYIGLFGEWSRPWMPGNGSFGPQVGFGGGIYLTVQPASACIQ